MKTGCGKVESKKPLPTYPQPRRLRNITSYGIRILRARSDSAEAARLRLPFDRNRIQRERSVGNGDVTGGIRCARLWRSLLVRNRGTTTWADIGNVAPCK